MDELSHLRGSEGYGVSSDDSRKKMPVNPLAGLCQNASGALRHGRYFGKENTYGQALWLAPE